jgi:hypothetical protein
VKRLEQALACLVALAILVLVLEGGMRLLGFAPRPTMNQFDATLGWRAKPSTTIRRHTSEFDVTFSTNSRGLRADESVGYAKSAGVTRILVIGDSFTLGYTVAREDTIPALLERMLAAEGRKVEVLNGGTEGYSTDQEVLWLAQEGRKYEPDVVVLQMYENDVFWNSQDRYLRYPKPRLIGAGGRGDDTALERLVDRPAILQDPGAEPWVERHTALGSLLLRIARPPELPMSEGPHPIPREWLVRVRDDAAGWEETATALRAFRLETGLLGAKALVLVVPDKAQVDAGARERMAAVIRDPAYEPSRPYRGLLARARAERLTVVDPEEALRAAAATANAPLYFEHDWHTTALGNRVLVRELGATLADPAFLGLPPRGAEIADDARTPSGSRGVLLERLLVLAIVWLVLGTLYSASNPGEGRVKSYASVGGLITGVALSFAIVRYAIGLLPIWLAIWISTAVLIGLLGAIVWYLRARLPVMAELFASFVRRGQWYALPVLVGLLSIGGLLIVAASSPWLAPFIYTLF